MQEMDRKTIEFGILGRVLMENAGKEAAQILFENYDIVGKNVAIVAGSGNNGGDGFVIARYLAQKNVNVSVCLLSKREKIKGDAAANFNLLKALGVPIFDISDEPSFLEYKAFLTKQDFWVDAILGTGLKSDVRGYFKQVIEFINNSNKPVFSVDIPSGLNSDTGQPCGICVKANITATFAFAKIGHVLHTGAYYTGKLKIVDIGIPKYITQQKIPLQRLLTHKTVRNSLKARHLDAHKGDAGHLLVIAGSTGKTGAAMMTAMSAMRTGAGLVTLGAPASLNTILETTLVEVMTYPLADTDGVVGLSSFNAIKNLLSGKQCLAIGPGLGTAPETKKLVQKIIQESNAPIVIDADGLNSLVGNTQILRKLKVPAVLTPHPGEMARLIDSNVKDIQQDRVKCARDFAVKFNVHLLLKGAGTVIAHPNGSIFINSSGNSGMAAGGMGDVLTGIIAGLIAQGYAPKTATHIAAYLHGAAADSVSENMGHFGFLATEVMNAVPLQIKKLFN